MHILNYNSFRLDYVDFWGHNDAVSDLPLRSVIWSELTASL